MGDGWRLNGRTMARLQARERSIVKKSAAVPESIDAYIATFPADIRAMLEEIRQTIRQIAIGAEEKISYRIPTFALHGNLIHFAAFKNHIGVYPGAAAIEQFKQELAGYHTAKGTIQLPLDEPIPTELITRIVRFNVEANSRKARGKASR